MINRILCILLISSFAWSQCDEGEVELWPDYFYGGCFDIATTTVIDFGGYYAQINDIIPPEIGQLVNLEHLDLSGAPNANGLGLIGDIPAEIGDLENLTYLNLSNNSFAEIPPEIGMLQNLTELHLTNSELSGFIPDEIGELISLTELDLSNNDLDGEIPFTIGELDNLLYFYCSNNALSGEIPAEVGDMNQLRWLVLDNNDLEGEIPSELADVPYLRTLNFSNNNLSGEIPDLYNTYLYRLLLQNNQLSGNLPMFDSPELIELNFSNNNLSGEIPFEWGDLNIGTIILSNNQLTGEIPEDLWNDGEDWWGDFVLDLSHNQLSGEIPESIFLDVVYLDLSHNQLTGELTEEMFVDFNYDSYYCWVWPGAYYNISNNQLSGVLPSTICNMAQCNFDISNNQICAPYPDCDDGEYGNNDWLDEDSQDISNCSESCNEGEVALWGNCYDIETTTELYLSSQGLEGEIPNELWQLTNLSVLDLAGNNLSGEISPDIGNLSLLHSINLQNNNLSGSIPQELDDLLYTRQLYLYNNNLSGELPEGIFWNPWYYEDAYDDDTFTRFEWINISGNQFTGELTEAMFDHAQWGYAGNNDDPYCWGWYPYQFNISNNQLSGVLPDNICGLSCVDDPSLGDNQFCGPYPDCIDWLIGEQDTTNCQEVCDDDDEDGICNELDACFGINDIDGDGWLDDEDGDGLCDDVDPCFGFASEAYYDEWSEQWVITEDNMDGDEYCDDADACVGINDMDGDGWTDDQDGDGICDDLDPCFGAANDVWYNHEEDELDIYSDNMDGDEYCDDADACVGINDMDGDGWTDDQDGDGICDDLDPCFGSSNSVWYNEEDEELEIYSDNMDGDEYCDDADACVGINDMDGDGWTDDQDGDEICDDLDPCFGAANDVWYNQEEEELEIYSDNMDGDEYCDDADACVGINDMDGDGWTDDQDGDGICDDLDPCFGAANDVWYNQEEEELEIYSDNIDGDEFCDDADACVGINDMDGDGQGDDQDGDGICDDLDPCFGAANDVWYNAEEDELEIYSDNMDGDEFCDDADACVGINDMDGDGLLDNFDGDEICDDLDPCFGWDNDYSIDEDGNLMIDSNDEDEDGICDDVDPCFGFDNWIDEDGCITYSDTDEDGECDDVDLFNDDAYIPEEYSMSSAYPNPFNPATNFQYEIPEYSMVDIYIYDLNGRVVDQLVSSYHSPGVYNVLWNASNHASGMYILFMKSNDFIHSQKISLTK